MTRLVAFARLIAVLALAAVASTLVGAPAVVASQAGASVAASDDGQAAGDDASDVPGVLPITVPRTLTVIPIYHTDDPRSYPSDAQQEVGRAAAEGAVEYWQKASHGLAQITSKVLEPQAVPSEDTKCVNRRSALDETAVEDYLGIEPSATNIVMFTFYQPDCATGQAGTMGWTIKVSLYDDAAYSDQSAGDLFPLIRNYIGPHEFGHALGLGHSDSTTMENLFSTCGGTWSGYCNTNEYGDLYTVMGGARAVVSPTIPQQVALGIPVRSEAAPLGSGTWEIGPAADFDGAGLQAVHFPVSFAGDTGTIWVENRYPTGMDSGIATPGGYGVGVVIRFMPDDWSVDVQSVIRSNAPTRDQAGETVITYPEGSEAVFPDGTTIRVVKSGTTATVAIDRKASAPTIARQPEPQVAQTISPMESMAHAVNAGYLADQRCTMTTKVSGMPAPTITWEVSSDRATWARVGTGTSFDCTTDRTTTSRLYYRARVSNDVGTVYSDPTPAWVVTPPKITFQPAKACYRSSEVVQVQVSDENSPVLSVGRGGTVQYPGGSFSYLIPVDETANPLEMTSRPLAVGAWLRYQTAVMDGDTYVGSAWSLAEPCVRPATDFPTIETQPPASVTVSSGHAVSVPAVVAGADPLSLQWQSSADGGNTWTDVQGQTRAALGFDNADSSMNGTWYRLVASNELGSTESSPCQLHVEAPTPTPTPSETTSPTPSPSETVTPSPSPSETPSPSVSPSVPALDWSKVSVSMQNTTGGQVAAGDQVTYQITVVNANDVAAVGVQLSDLLPAGMVLADGQEAAWTQCGSLATSVPFDLAPQSQVTIELSVITSQAAIGNPVNLVALDQRATIAQCQSVSATPGCATDTQPLTITSALTPTPTPTSTPNPSQSATPTPSETTSPTPSPSETVTPSPSPSETPSPSVSPSVPALDWSKVSVSMQNTTGGQAVAGDRVTYQITVTNTNDVEATGVRLSDLLPAGMVLADGQEVAWTQSGSLATSVPFDLAPQTQVTIELSVITSQAAIGNPVNLVALDQRATITQCQNVPATPGCATDTQPLTITSALTPTPTPTSTPNPSQSATPTPTETTSPTSSPTPRPTETTTPRPSSTPTPSETTTPTASPSPSGTVTPSPSETPSPSVSPSVPVVDWSTVSVSMQNTTGGQVAAGDQVTYQITVVNGNDVDVVGAILQDLLPTGVDLAAGQESVWTQTGRQATSVAFDVARQSQVTIEVNVTTSQAGEGAVTNLVSLSPLATIPQCQSAPTTPGCATDTVTITPAATPTPSPTLTTSPEPTLTETPTPQPTPTPTPTATPAPTPSPTATLSPSASPSPSGTGAPTPSPTPSTTPTQSPPASPSPTASPSVPVLDWSKVDVTVKNTADGPVVAGSPVTYQITVTNRNDAEATNVALIDMLPSGMGLAGGQAALWSAAGNTVTSVPFTLAAQAQVTIELVATTSPAAAGSPANLVALTQRASISQCQATPARPGCATDTEPLTVVAATSPSPTLSPSGSPTPAHSQIATATPTASGTPTPSSSPTPTATPTSSPTPTMTTTPSPTPSSSAAASATPSPSAPALDWSKVSITVANTAVGQVAGGEHLTYRITVRNANDVDAVGITLSDRLPGGAALARGQELSWSSDGQNVTSIPFTVTRNSQLTIELTITTREDFAGTLVNTLALNQQATITLCLTEPAAPGCATDSVIITRSVSPTPTVTESQRSIADPTATVNPSPAVTQLSAVDAGAGGGIIWQDSSGGDGTSTGTQNAATKANRPTSLPFTGGVALGGAALAVGLIAIGVLLILRRRAARAEQQ